MIGTLANALAIAIGGFIGLALKSGLKEKYSIAIMNALGMSVLFAGLSGAIGNLLSDGAEPALFIVSLAIGSVIGALIGITEKLEGLGALIEAKAHGSKSKGGFAEPFAQASMIFCVGTMAILGSIQSGTHSGNSILFAKSALDGMTALIMAAADGAGVLFAAISVLIYQGALTLLAGAVEPILTEAMLREISIVGGVIVTAIGIDMLGIKKMKIADFLPAIFVPVIYYLLKANWG